MGMGKWRDGEGKSKSGVKGNRRKRKGRKK